MWNLLGKDPDYVYHFTRKDKVESIKKDRQLKKFKDIYVFACESYEDCITVIKNTFLNPDARYIDFDGLVKKYSDRDLEDYVILKCKTRYAKPILWFRSESAKNESIDGLTIAYKGNLPIDVIEVLEINL